MAFSYDAAGNRLQMAETLNGSAVRNTNYSYDDVNRLVTVNFDENGDGSVDETVQYGYDAGGLRTKLRMPGVVDVLYTYNARGNLILLGDWNLSSPASITGYGYDGVDRLLRQTSNSLASTYAYDAASRLKLLQHTSNNRTLGHFAYTVDAASRRTYAYEAVPRSTTGTTTVSYNNAAVDPYQGTWTNNTTDGFKESTDANAVLRVGILSNAPILKMGVGPDHGKYEIYVDDALEQTVDGYAAAPATQTINLSLADEGPHTVEIHSTGTKNTASTGYLVRFKSIGTAAGSRLYDLRTTGYTYDKASRLTSAKVYYGTRTSGSASPAYTYAYDPAGNRTRQIVSGATTNYSYNAANQLISDGTHSFSYDAAGRMISDGVNSYVWDQADRLVSEGGAIYHYNGVGQRVQQTVGGNTTDYLLDVQRPLWEVIAATTGGSTTRYVHGLQRRAEAAKPGHELELDSDGCAWQRARDARRQRDAAGEPTVLALRRADAAQRQQPERLWLHRRTDGQQRVLVSAGAVLSPFDRWIYCT